MSTANETLVRTAYAAYEQGDVTALLGTVDPNLEWTYLDPSEANPEPQICHGRGELEIALQRQLRRGLSVQLEELIANGDQVMVTLRIPGVEAHRVRHANERNYDVLTVRDGHIVAIRACRDRAEALALPAAAAGQSPPAGSATANGSAAEAYIEPLCVSHHSLCA